MKINELLKGLAVSAPAELELSRIVIDSRELKAGDIFCALQGEKQDGHIFLKSALAAGAAAVIAAKNRLSDFPGLPSDKLIICQDPLKLLQQIASRYAARIPLIMIGITGSSGKTSTRQLIAHILQQDFPVVQSLKNFNNHIGYPLSLLEWREHQKFAVMELGASHQGEIAALCQLRAPDIALITSIAPAHIEGFGSIDGVQQAKYELLDAVSAHGMLFLNANDERVAAYPTRGRETVKYGVDVSADIMVRIIDFDADARPLIEWEAEHIQLQTPGPHAAQNAAAAIAVSLKCGSSIHSIKKGLESFLPNESRGYVRNIRGVKILNDSYNANPQSMQAAIQTVAKMKTSGKRFLVLGDMLELGDWETDFHKAIGQLAAELKIDYLFAYGPRMEAAVKKARKMDMMNAIHFTSKDILASTLNSVLNQGDIVLIKGSRGMAMETVINALGGEK
jgi:UDP-N-acetylmuramoyl-tripeptide--D-alanyl-D-alanine ligase